MEPMTSAGAARAVLLQNPNGPRTVNGPHRGGELSALCRIRELARLVESSVEVASWQGCARTFASRQGHRIPYDKPIILTPLDEENGEPNGESFPVQGRNISVSGISFMHRDPLPCRKAALTLYEETGSPVTLLVRLRWCRCTREGIYQSGGRFLRVIAPSDHSDADAGDSRPIDA